MNNKIPSEIEKKEFKLLHENKQSIEEFIECCQELNHTHQVAFSTYHNALTQICFTCKEIRTSIKKGDLK